MRGKVDTISSSYRKPSSVVIFRYHDYRLFLHDVLEALQVSVYRFSRRQMALAAGFTTPNLFQLVIAGQRNLGEEAVCRITAILELNKDESHFFRHLVLMNQASTHEEKDRHYRQLAKSRRYSLLQEDEKELYAFYSRWYYPVVRELVTTQGFSADPAWIAHRISPPISRDEAARALRVLEKCGQIRKTPQGYVQQDPVITTGREVTSVAVTNFHKAMLQKASEAIDTQSSEQRDVSALTFAASPKTYRAIVQEVYSFQQRIIELLERETEASEVYQLNFQLFPCTNHENEDRH